MQNNVNMKKKFYLIFMYYNYHKHPIYGCTICAFSLTVLTVLTVDSVETVEFGRDKALGTLVIFTSAKKEKKENKS